MPPITSLPSLVVGYAIACLLLAWIARSRGRSPFGWLVIALVLSPVLAMVALWFVKDLEHERQQTREFLNRAKQRRHRRDPHDTFSRTRERQEQEIHLTVITARHARRHQAEPAPTTRRLRARENRTPATVIMQM